MLYAVIKRFGSLREITDSMFPEARKLAHLGISMMPVRVGQNTSLSVYAAAFTPDIRVNFPRTAESDKCHHGSSVCKSLIPRPFHCSQTSYSRAWGVILNLGKRRAESRFTQTLMPTRGVRLTSSSPRQLPMTALC